LTPDPLSFCKLGKGLSVLQSFFLVAGLVTSCALGGSSVKLNTVQRPLNPVPSAFTECDKPECFFNTAFEAASIGDFDAAIVSYGKAATAVDSDCDRAHAWAGKEAAMEAKELYMNSGWSGRPTQFFWLRIQALTKQLKCVYTR
jgi:hypothetical protein